ncbi:hypothetical protein LDO32_00675 [Luteimonas sp. Y-2-2-4F]|nr:hypothetical protein [Luteimonas sp. Y-2-2-4F]MCD9030250.1 hypothetical protein [Luteimonas sp. Y-2-2-4F]
MRLRTCSLALLPLLLCACGAQDTAGPPGTPTPSPANQEAPHVADTRQPAAPLPAPRADSVLYFISGVDGDGATGYEIANGSWIHYWYGLEFEAAGKRYYTGFAWITPEKYGNARERDDIDPQARVTLAHATFEASAPGSNTPWTLLGNEQWIGEFGAAERGNEVDTSRTPQTHATPSGRLLLLVPTRSADAGGAFQRTVEALVFNPHELQSVDERKWTYLGTLPAGDGGAATEFVAREGSDLPDLRLPGDKPLEYRYDPAHTTYRSTSR